jgi:protein-disulfide isomerase-like protein with CxxC motif
MKEEANYRMVFVANCYRPLTRTPEDALEVMREIEAACGLQFTDIVNNSNLASETTPETIAASINYMDKLSQLSGLPIWLTTAENIPLRSAAA